MIRPPRSPGASPGSGRAPDPTSPGEPMSDHAHGYQTDSRWGGLTFVYSLLLWAALLGVFLGVGHVLARNMMAAHHAEAHAESGE